MPRAELMLETLINNPGMTLRELARVLGFSDQTRSHSVPIDKYADALTRAYGYLVYSEGDKFYVTPGPRLKPQIKRQVRSADRLSVGGLWHTNGIGGHDMIAGRTIANIDQQGLAPRS